MTMFSSQWFATTSFSGDFYGDLQALGLSGTCVLCLDAGESTSYSSGQKWLDLSGNGYDFFLGADGSASSDDPTFNGVAGDLSSSEFWSFDGSQLFTYDTDNEDWMNEMAQDGADFTLLAWAYSGTVADDHTWFGTGSATTGIVYKTSHSGDSRLNVYNGSSSVLETDSGSSLSDSAWHLLGISINEASGSSDSFHFFDGTAATFTATYNPEPSTGDSSKMEIGGRPGAGSPSVLLNGDRMAGFMAFTSSLTESECDSIFDRQKARFGI